MHPLRAIHNMKCLIEILIFFKWSNTQVKWGYDPHTACEWDLIWNAMCRSVHEGGKTTLAEKNWKQRRCKVVLASSPIYSFALYVHRYAYMPGNVHGYACMYVCEHLEVRCPPLVVFPSNHPPCFLILGFWLVSDSWIGLSMLQGFTCLSFSRDWLLSVLWYPVCLLCFWYRFWDSNTDPDVGAASTLPDGAVSPLLLIAFFLRKGCTLLLRLS